MLFQTGCRQTPNVIKMDRLTIKIQCGWNVRTSRELLLGSTNSTQQNNLLTNESLKLICYLVQTKESFVHKPATTMACDSKYKQHIVDKY